MKNKSFVKDLSKIGRDLNDVIIIDNTPGCYRLQKHNALPIESWFEDPHDEELLKMIPLLTKLAKVNDVRPFIKKIVKNGKINYAKMSKVFKESNKKSDKSLIEDRPLSKAGLDSAKPVVKKPSPRPQRNDDCVLNKTSDEASKISQQIKSQYKPIIKSTHILKYPHKGEIFGSPIKSGKTKQKCKKKKLTKKSFVKKDNLEKSRIDVSKSKQLLNSDIEEIGPDQSLKVSSDISRSRLIESSRPVPVFEIEDKIESKKQPDTSSQLANYAHKLRRSYFNFGSQNVSEVRPYLRY